MTTAAHWVDAFLEAIQTNRFEDAEQALEELGQLDPALAARPVYRTMLAVRKGNARDALYELGEDAPELRAMCLRMMGDPTWEGLARSLAEDSPDPTVREAMQALLGLATDRVDTPQS